MARLGSKGFYTLDGERVPSVTTVIGNNLGWDKNVLIGWARKEAMAGRDPYKVRDQAGSIGTLAHLMIQRLILAEAEHPFQINFNEWTNEQQAAAYRCVEAFTAWQQGHTVVSRATELSLVSPRYRYGGTLDWVVDLDGIGTYVDFKSSKGIWVSHKIQVAAYIWLFWEINGIWLKPMLLHLGKDDGSFTPHSLHNLQPYWRVFQLLLELNRLKQQIDP